MYLSARVTRSRKGEEGSGMSERERERAKGRCTQNGGREGKKGCSNTLEYRGPPKVLVRHKQSAIVDYGSDIAPAR